MMGKSPRQEQPEDGGQRQSRQKRLAKRPDNVFDVREGHGDADDSFLPGAGLVEGTVEHVVSNGRAETDRGSGSVAQGLDDFRTVGVIFHLFGDLGGVTEHAAVGGDDRNPRTELS